MQQYSNHKNARRRRKVAMDRKPVWKNDRKLPQPGEGKSHAISGSTEGPNQEEPKEVHYKTHHNQKGKIQIQRENLKAAREKQKVTYKGAPVKLAVDFSTETIQARRKWQEIFQVLKSKDLQARLLYPARLSIKMEGEIRSFPDKRRLKEYTSTKPALQDMLKGLL